MAHYISALPSAAELAAMQALSAESSSGEKNRLILMIGYWPPTDVGVTARHGMLWQWKDKAPVTLEGKTYDVVAISTTFAERKGTWPPPDFDQDYWSKGDAGSPILVDYRDTSTKFWALVAEHRPIAIMSFSRWKFNKEWALDAWATNWARDQDTPPLAANKFWTLELGPWKNNAGVLQGTETWDKPYIGGSADDPSPNKSVGAIKYNPPDRSKDALERRDSNLPMDEIIEAIEDADPSLDVEPFKNNTEGPGNFVSNFLAYHVAWYREWSIANLDENKRCLRAGHTHVGGQVTVADAAHAIEYQLKELFKVLPASS